MKDQPKHTAGPFDIRPIMGEDDVEVYSVSTGESLATVHPRGWRHDDAPEYETALHNASLFKAAPQLRASMQQLLNDEKERLSPSTTARLKSLLAEIDSKPGQAFDNDKKKQIQEWNELLRAQADEMAGRNNANGERDLYGPDAESSEDGEEEEFGHSF